MKHIKNLTTLTCSFLFSSTLYIGTLLNYLPAKRLLPFYLWGMLAIILGCILILFAGLVLDTFKTPKSYVEFNQDFGWLVSLESWISVVWSFVFASQSMYQFAIAIVLIEVFTVLLRMVLLAAPVETLQKNS